MFLSRKVVWLDEEQKFADSATYKSKNKKLSFITKPTWSVCVCIYIYWWLHEILICSIIEAFFLFLISFALLKFQAKRKYIWKKTKKKSNWIDLFALSLVYDFKYNLYFVPIEICAPYLMGPSPPLFLYLFQVNLNISIPKTIKTENSVTLLRL